MTYLAPFLRVVVSGRMYNVEEWSWSLNFIGGSALTAPTVVPPAMVSALSTFVTSSGVMTKDAAVDLLKVNLIGEDGKYVNSTTVQHEYTTPVVGVGTAQMAPQLSLAVSTRTAAARGRASKGRFYLPLPATLPGTDGRISTSLQSSVLAACKVLVDAWNTALPDWQAGVVSNIGNGAQLPITHLRLGRVLDTIRSRRDKFDEAYIESPIVQ